MSIQRTFVSLVAVAAAVLGLAACSEDPQVMTGEAIKQDNASYQGVGSSQYAQTGWKPGDKGSWEQQLKTRAQYGQNDYTRMSNK